MKLTIYSLITTSILFLSCNNSSEVKNDLEKQNLNGRVKSITENSYRAVEKFGEIVKGEKLVDKIFNKENRLTTFNEKGYETESLVGFWPAKFKYNENNQKIEENWYDSDTKIFYKYNDKGFIVESNNYYKKGLVQKVKIVCDEEGNEIERNSYDTNGKLDYKQKNTFKDGKLIETKEYDGDGTLSSSTKRKYDENGNETENIIYDSYGEVSLKSTCKYDENNQIIEAINITNNAFNKSQTKNKYIYRKLDANKNWTESIQFENDAPKLIIERIIEYYK